MKIENEYENLCQNCESMNKIVSRVMKQIKLPPTATGCCNQCGHETTFLIKSTKYLNNETITKLLCGKCLPISEEKQTITSNEFIHEEINQYKCEYCDSTFDNKKRLHEHLLSIHGINSFEEVLVDTNEISEDIFPNTNLQGHPS